MLSDRTYMQSLQRVLVVEDDVDIQAVVRMALELVGGYTVEICSGGRSALRVAETFKPALVLLDVMMPDMDGPTVLKHLRAQPATARLPIVFVTAKAQAHEVAAYRALGALGVISKPFDPMTLSTQLANIFNDSNSSGDTAGVSS